MCYFLHEDAVQPAGSYYAWRCGRPFGLDSLNGSECAILVKESGSVFFHLQTMCAAIELAQKKAVFRAPVEAVAH